MKTCPICRIRYGRPIASSTCKEHSVGSQAEYLTEYRERIRITRQINDEKYCSFENLARVKGWANGLEKRR